MFRFLVKLFIVTTLMLVFNNKASAHISIDIEPDELQRLGEILVESYFEQNLLSGRSRLSHCKKITQSIAQICAIMFSLVGANLITNALQPISMSNTEENTTSFIQPTPFKPSEKCNYDFGCDRGVCWRSCETASNVPESWCYASPPNETMKIKPCTHALDCSPCWKCGGVCNSPQK